MVQIDLKAPEVQREFGTILPSLTVKHDSSDNKKIIPKRTLAETHMTNVMKTFWADENGATVVDMTMLMAALVGLCLAVTVQVSNGMGTASGELSTTVTDVPVDQTW